MAECGYDTYLRPGGAYRTLGWFTDPVFSTMLEYGDTSLVEVILHEMVHRTVFVKHQGDFNEGAATFVGEKGTEALFRKAGDAYPHSFEELRETRETRKLFQETMVEMNDRLRVLYGSELESRRKSGNERRSSAAPRRRCTSEIRSYVWMHYRSSLVLSH